MDGTKRGGKKKRTNEERKKENERKMREREHVNNIPQLLSAKAIAVVCRVRSGIERTEDFTICIEGEREREREREKVSSPHKQQRLRTVSSSSCLIILFALQSVTDLQFKKSCCPA
jgi:hypothetical protein